MTVRHAAGSVSHGRTFGTLSHSMMCGRPGHPALVVIRARDKCAESIDDGDDRVLRHALALEDTEDAVGLDVQVVRVLVEPPAGLAA